MAKSILKKSKHLNGNSKAKYVKPSKSKSTLDSKKVTLGGNRVVSSSRPQSEVDTGSSKNSRPRTKQVKNALSREKNKPKTEKKRYGIDRLKAKKKGSNVGRKKSCGVKKGSGVIGEKSGVEKVRFGVGSESSESDIKNSLVELRDARTEGTWVQCSRRACGKWRHLEERDPSSVRINWVCGDNPDIKFRDCSAAEQDWKEVEDKFVENRFTVGSLVWAKMVGWPRWPAMVEDDPDTGDFFWTGVRGGRWEERPSHYHVVFFDKEERGVRRAWVADSMVDKLTEHNVANSVRKKNKHEERRKKAFELAMKAGNMHLERRRRECGFAKRFLGNWGSVRPRHQAKKSSPVPCDSDEESSEFGSFFRDSEDDLDNKVRLNCSKNAMSSMEDSCEKISMTREELLTDIFESGTSKNRKKRLNQVDLPVAKKSRPSPEIVPRSSISYNLEYGQKLGKITEVPVDLPIAKKSRPSSEILPQKLRKAGESNMIKSRKSSDPKPVQRPGKGPEDPVHLYVAKKSLPFPEIVGSCVPTN